jgi:hypothetical protein
MKQIGIEHGLEELKTAPDGHLLGLIVLDSIGITLDDMAGRVCIRNVRSVLIPSLEKPNCVYELPSEIHRSKNVVIQLTPEVCKDLKVSYNKLFDFY